MRKCETAFAFIAAMECTCFNRLQTHRGKDLDAVTQDTQVTS